MATGPAIVWFRRDLRLADNPALRAAAAGGRPVLPVYILDKDPVAGGASRWWLHHSLAALDAALRAAGSRLLLRRGAPDAVLADLAAEAGAGTVVWNRRYEPAAVASDTAVKAALKRRGLAVESFGATLLFEPWAIRTGSGAPYRVFTPFWRACLEAPEPDRPRPAPAPIAAPETWPDGDALDGWTLLPSRPDWAGGLRAEWLSDGAPPGEAGARIRLSRFLGSAAAGYRDLRDRPGIEGTSRLSPHLHFGEIGPRQVWHAVRAAGDSSGHEAFLREIGWREFAAHLLFHRPEMAERPLRPEFEAFPWRDDPAALDAWHRGRTGFPIVDAGMRQLWQTGWMHNRVRMIVASFLVKDLLLPWQAGAAWFLDTLVDADLAANSAGWQWASGCGIDAAPWFRIFNPVTQGEKFDPGGAYVRRFLPELAGLPDRWLHRPWAAPEAALRAAGLVLGRDYPAPLVDHAVARRRALAAYATVGKVMAATEETES